jgi:hypothetical protein
VGPVAVIYGGLSTAVYLDPGSGNVVEGAKAQLPQSLEILNDQYRLDLLSDVVSPKEDSVSVPNATSF